MYLFHVLIRAAPATGHTVGSSSQPVGTVFQQLMGKYQLSTTAQASEPKKEDPSSSSPLPGVVNQYRCVSVQYSSRSSRLAKLYLELIVTSSTLEFGI